VETRERSRGVPAGIARAVLPALVAFFGIFFGLLGFLLNLLAAFGSLLGGPGRSLLRRIAALVGAASRVLTPQRALAVVVTGAAVLLALSQFADYRGVSIGTDAYSGVETVAPAPQVDREQTGDAHGYAMVPVAVLSLLLLGAALRGRWRLCRLIALAGVAAIAVGLIVDRPAGLDPGRTALAYDGAEANLLSGFYAQIFSGLLLAVSSLLLGRELRLSVAGARGPEERDRVSPARRLLGRRPRVGGAQA